MFFEKPLYYRYSNYLKEKYGEKVYKLPVNLPVSCPNRQGGKRGCAFCSPQGTGFEALGNNVSVSDQLAQNRSRIEGKYHAHKFIAYFQAYSNTYASVDKLKSIYDDAFCDERVIGISIGTRPDCVDEEKIKTNGSIDDILTDAINHPIGHVANALFNVWFNTKPKDNDGLSQDIKDILFQFCDRNIKKFSYARVFLGRYLIPLYRVDKEWTKKNIIPLFNWDDDKICARIMWTGFFSRNQIDISLMYELKKEFLYNACHYDELGHIGDYFVNMLTYMALNNYKVYTKAEYQKTFSHLMPKAFEKISKILELTIRNSPNKNNTFNHMVKPFWISLENKDVRSVTSKISLNFAQLIIESDSKFKDTLGLFGDYLIPLENSFYVLYKLKETKLCQEYPEQVLLLLSKIIGSHTHDLIDLKLILEDIEKASPILKKKKNFKNLNILASDTSSRY